MRSDDDVYLAMQLRTLRPRARGAEEWNAYIAESLRLAISLYASDARLPLDEIADELGSLDFRRVAEAVAARLPCPIEAEHSAQSWLLALAALMRSSADPRLEALRPLLTRLQVLS